jgi:hypothetical protein
MGDTLYRDTFEESENVALDGDRRGKGSQI